MLDLTVTETALDDGRIRYELGRANWQSREIPDIRRPGAVVQLAPNRMIDVLILGDGYETAASFRTALDDWLVDLYAVEVYARFAGCLRIRALYTESVEPVSVTRNSYYGCLLGPKGDLASQERWEEIGTDPKDVAFREALWRSVDTFDDLHLRSYPLDLSIGADLVVDEGDLRGQYRNLVVAMLVSPTSGGFNGVVPRPAPDGDHKVRVSFGAFAIHELTHGLGMLRDEYVHNRAEQIENSDPVVPSVFSLANVRYSNRIDEVPWLHLSPWGLVRRSAAGRQPSPVVGWLWLGGGVGLRTEPGLDGDIGVWHSEYMCLMNGLHVNYQFTQYGNDPTDNPFDDVDGADLRDPTWMCLWCQELVTIRILERTDQLLEPGDPTDGTEQGRLWYTRWVDQLRAGYLQLFDVATQIVDREAYYASLAPPPGPNGEPLWQSDLYWVPKAAPRLAGPLAPPLTNEELLLLTVG